jgi:hypothetical protein
MAGASGSPRIASESGDAYIEAHPKKTGKHGGARPGAGRKSIPGETRRVLVVLDESTIERAREIGAGNLSLGVREAVNKFQKI